MIPLTDLYVKRLIERGLERLRTYDLEQYFEYASPKTIKSMDTLLHDYEISVLCGYPREPVQLPCIVVTISGEDEVDYGLGGGIDEGYEDLDENYLNWGEGLHDIVANTQMRMQLKMEVWSDNAVITSFLYSVVKYILLSARKEMEEEGFMLSTVSGGDLEPAPDYFTVFVYRKAVMLSLEYTIRYHVDKMFAGKDDGMAEIGTTTDKLDIRMEGLNGKEH